MALQDVKNSAVGIINEVMRKLGLKTVTNLSDTKLSSVLTDFLNDVVDEISDYGDWQEMFRETTVQSISSIGTYEIPVSGNVKNILEVSWDRQVSPLDVVSIEEILRLQRVGTKGGNPRNYAVVGVSANNPIIRISSIPTTAAPIVVAYYKKPAVIIAATANNSAMPAFPARMLVQGVYAKALLEENGGTQTPEYQVAYTEYQRMRNETLNRFNYDTGPNEIRFVPS